MNTNQTNLNRKAEFFTKDEGLWEIRSVYSSVYGKTNKQTKNLRGIERTQKILETILAAFL